MKKMTTDNPFFEFMGYIGDWIILNILFIITSLPIITIGMSVTAMYKVSMRRARGESSYIAREYFQACKEEWKESTKLWVIFLLSGALILFDIFYAQNLGIVMSVAVGCLAFIWGAVFSYVFPLQARFANTTVNTFKNAFYLALRNLPRTILIVVLNSIPVLCIAQGPFVTMMAIPVYCLIGFGLTAKINGILFTKMFHTLAEKEGKYANSTE